MALGPIMLDLRGVTLEQDERNILKHPLVGGVILFSRNYESVGQLSALVDSIHAVREPMLLVAVDHEGGRIQRFRQGFTQLPACHLIGNQYDRDCTYGASLAEKAGWLMAIELRSVGIDFSFAPVLDLFKGMSKVIGDRSFHKDPEVVAILARRYIEGMKRAGMAAVGKHFPGHGAVKEDSHHEIPIDYRRYEDIQMDDLVAFERLIHAGLAAIMPAHVIYPTVDDKPAGFSKIWLKQILRRQLGFQGTIFSDDISMAGAEFAGDYIQRTNMALDAGCDMVLVCNNQQAAITILDEMKRDPDPVSQVRLMRMHGRLEITREKMQKDNEWQKTVAEISSLETNPELELGDDAT